MVIMGSLSNGGPYREQLMLTLDHVLSENGAVTSVDSICMDSVEGGRVGVLRACAGAVSILMAATFFHESF